MFLLHRNIIIKLSASMELPPISSISYYKNWSTVSNSVWDIAIDEMVKAGNEEREIAIKNEDVDENGVSMFTGNSWWPVVKKITQNKI